MSLKNDLLNIIKQYIKDNNLSYSDIEKKTGFSKSRISKILNKGLISNISTFEKFLDGLGIEIEVKFNTGGENE